MTVLLALVVGSFIAAVIITLGELYLQHGDRR